MVRTDSADYGRAVITAARRGGARFSVTARVNFAVSKAITGIDPDAWVPISCTRTRSGTRPSSGWIPMAESRSIPHRHRSMTP